MKNKFRWITVPDFATYLYSCSDQNSGIGIDANQGNKLESRNRPTQVDQQIFFCFLACLAGPGIEPGPLAVRVPSPNNWTTREFLINGFFLKFYLFIYYVYLFIWLHWVLIAARGLSLVVAGGLFIAVTSWARAWALGWVGSVVVVRRLSRPSAYGIFPDQGSNPVLAVRFLTTEPPGKPNFCFHIFIDC